MTRALYSTDASLYKIDPIGVLIPKRVDDVQAAVEEAGRFGVPVLARGGGSSLAGQTVGAALVIDFSRHLDQVLELNLEAREVRVQPGIVLDALNAALRPHGVMIGPDPASSNRATLGGMTANNATGTHSILYGSVVDHIRRAQVLLADGSDATFEALNPDQWRQRAQRSSFEGQVYQALETLFEEEAAVIRRDTPRHWRRAGGYRLERMLGGKKNLAHLLCGSEGTLAIATELTYGLVPRPRRTALGVVHFHTRREALETVALILDTEPAAVELFDRVGLDRCRQVPDFADRLTFVDGDPEALLITEYYGEGEDQLKRKIIHLSDVLRAHRRGYATVHVLHPAEIANVWQVRKEGLGLVMGVRGDHKAVAVIEDAAVPVEHLPDYVEALEQIFDETNTRNVVYAHASAGCLHIRPFINLKDAAEVKKMEEITVASAGLVAKFGGANSSEHGEGLARSWLAPRFYGPDLYAAYRRTKQAFDPANRFNPGKVVEAPPMTENLRINPRYEVVELQQSLDFSDDGGFARSVEVCSGVGSCRKMTGSMCPSFMVTREEAHSTRGRANALRSAMAGELDPDALTGKALYEVMDLCISCKACKAECPSAVDMAKLKMGWQEHYWKANRMPLRERLFAHMPRLSRLVAGPLAPMANRVNGLGVVRRMMDRRLRISEERTLPPFAREPFTTWFRKQPKLKGERPLVVLFHDTFNTYHKTEASKAAVEFFHGIGYAVQLGGHRCCGRTYMSKGMVDEARAAARQTVDALFPLAEEGLPIVGLEPSCVLSLRDEYKALLPGDPKVTAVAEAAYTFEEYVAGLADTGQLDDVRWKQESGRVLLHGHCHQKALVGTGPAERCLSLPGYHVEPIASSCCGMAGAFGYEKENLHWSLAMAERSLAPTVRAAPPEALIAAAGFSCRSQIQHTTDRHALHPAEILRDALAEGVAEFGMRSAEWETDRREVNRR